MLTNKLILKQSKERELVQMIKDLSKIAKDLKIRKRDSKLWSLSFNIRTYKNHFQISSKLTVLYQELYQLRYGPSPHTPHDSYGCKTQVREYDNKKIRQFIRGLDRKLCIIEEQLSV